MIIFFLKKFSIDTIQSTVLDIKLKSYEKKVLRKRTELAKRYFKNLDNIKQIKLFHLKKSNKSCFHQFVIRTDKRNILKKYLEKKGIDTMIHYPYMLNELEFFKNKKKLKNSYKLGVRF